MAKILNDQICPKCASSKCVIGRLDLGDSDTKLDGSFHPIHIKTALIIRDYPQAKVLSNQYFHACSDCGHMWSKIDVSELNTSLAEHDWEPGQPQIAPAETVPFVQWFLAVVIAGLLSAIYFFNYNA